MLSTQALMPGRRLAPLGTAPKQFTFVFGDLYLRGRIPQGRDHFELVPERRLAAVTDRGCVHTTNQDDVRVRSTTIDAFRLTIMVVCDGVSSGANAEQASSVGSTVASDYLLKNLRLGGEPREAMRGAILAADAAVRDIPYGAGSKQRPVNPPGATIVAATTMRRRLIVGWIGDSRCYLVEPTGVRLLTHDHSWVNHVVENGLMSEEEALKRPEAHQISRCIGPLHGDRKYDIPEPSIAGYHLPETGKVLLCTDGLWNYLPNIEKLRSLIQFGPDAPDTLTQARSLVDYAIKQGGKDNITAALLTI